MELPGQRRLTRRFLSEFHSKQSNSNAAAPPLTSTTSTTTAMFVATKPPFVPNSTAAGVAQPALQSTPGSLAEQAALMEQFGGFARKSTEELLIQSFVESNSKVSLPPSLPPVADNLGLTHVADLDKFSRGDSEELFSSWVSAGTHNQNTEITVGAATTAHLQRPRQDQPRRVSGELAAIIKQQNNFNNNFTLSSIDYYQRVDGVDDMYMSQKSFLDADNSLDVPPKSRLSNGSSAHGRPAPDLYETSIAHNIWLESEAPVTRSRSSELRRRFAEVGSVAHPQVNPSSRPGPYKEQSCITTANGWTTATQSLASTAKPDPSSSQRPPVSTSLSDCVGMLKGSLNRAKQRLGSQPGNYAGVSDDAKGKKAQHQGMNGDITISPPGILDSSSIRMKPSNGGSKWPNAAAEKPVHTNTDNNNNVSSRSIDESYAFPVTNLSDSSGGPPNLGSNEMLGNSGQAKLMGRTKSLKRGNAELDHVLAEPISISDLDGLEFQGSVKNQEHLSKIPDTNLRRMGSINSAQRSEYAAGPVLRSPMRSPEQPAGPNTDVIDDATKRRRVDRQRKMAEAKGRGATSVAAPPDLQLQAALKRLDALEKEVRSLRMNLSFMNRKDSEQTKHIEELEEENKELKKINLSLTGSDMQI